MTRPRVLVPLDGSPLSEAILPAVRALDPSEVIRFSAPAGGAPPAEAILAAAREARVDLIALTTHGRSGFDHLVLGSVAERVIRSSPVPVLALRAEKPAGGPEPLRLFERPLAPDDGSEAFFRALACLGRIAPRGTRPLLYGVVETWDDVPPVPPSHPVASPIRDFLRMRCAWLEKDLRADALRALDMGLEADVRVEQGRPGRRIIAVAEALPASLIVMGTHGRSGVSRWALGSVMEQVLRAATVPLLIGR